MSAFSTARSIVIGALLVFLALLPVYVVATGHWMKPEPMPSKADMPTA